MQLSRPAVYSSVVSSTSVQRCSESSSSSMARCHWAPIAPLFSTRDRPVLVGIPSALPDRAAPRCALPSTPGTLISFWTRRWHPMHHCSDTGRRGQRRGRPPGQRRRLLRPRPGGHTLPSRWSTRQRKRQDRRCAGSRSSERLRPRRPVVPQPGRRSPTATPAAPGTCSSLPTRSDGIVCAVLHSTLARLVRLMVQ